MKRDRLTAGTQNMAQLSTDSRQHRTEHIQLSTKQLARSVPSSSNETVAVSSRNKQAAVQAERPHVVQLLLLSASTGSHFRAITTAAWPTTPTPTTTRSITSRKGLKRDLSEPSVA